MDHRYRGESYPASPPACAGSVCVTYDTRAGGGYALPYTGTSAPLVGAESSDRRKATTPAISAGLTQRSKSASGIAARLAAVSITLGRIALARIRSFRYSTSRALTNAITAAFEEM